jgi:hypothetical protein
MSIRGHIPPSFLTVSILPQAFARAGSIDVEINEDDYMPPSLRSTNRQVRRAASCGRKKTLRFVGFTLTTNQGLKDAF